ncbi:MAG: hypothetical protein NWS57_03455, partial [Burkholderiaceae bacterium]|nr:hypothetical protein [Burkholderiaceae bacterium]
MIDLRLPLAVLASR